MSTTRSDGRHAQGGHRRGDRGRAGRRQLRDRECRERRLGHGVVLERHHRPRPAQPSQPHGYGTNGGDRGGQPWGGQRSDETVLTGDTAAKVKAAAEAKVPGGPYVRVETDADGHAKYEAHMTKADGTPVTVYVNEQFGVVSVESR